MALQYQNSGEMDDILNGLKDSQPSVRLRSIAEMGKMGEVGAAYMPLAQEAAALFNDPDVKVQAAAISAVGNMGQMGASYVEDITAKFNSQEKQVQQAAIAAIGRLGEHATSQIPALEALLEDKQLDLVTDACVSLGQLKATGSAPKLVKLMSGSDVEVTIGAIIGLSTMDQNAKDIGKMLSHKIPRVKAAALNMIVNMSDYDGCSSQAAQLIEDGDSYVRIGAGNYITKVGDKASDQVTALGKLLASSNPGVKSAAAMALAGVGEKAESQVSALIPLLADKSEDDGTVNTTKAGVKHRAISGYRKTCCAAAYALGAIGEKASAACEELVKGLESSDYEMQIACALALSKMGAAGANYEDEVARLFDEPNPAVVANALIAYGAMAKATSPTPNHSMKVVEYLTAQNPAIRAAAASSLGEMGEETVAYLEDLVKLFGDQSWNVQMAACEAVTKCGEMGEMYAADIARLMFGDAVPVRICAVTSLGKMTDRGPCYVEEVVEMLKDPVTDVRIAALKTLQAFGEETVADFRLEINEVLDRDPLDKVKEAAKPVLALGA